MAVTVVRCCSSSRSPPIPHHGARRASEFGQRARIYGKGASLPFKSEGHIFPSFGDVLIQAFTHPAFKTLTFKKSKSKGGYGTDKITPHRAVILAHNGHQIITGSQFHGMGLLVTNAFMFLMPPEAFAGACEADNSVFNMPLLLSVSLIGATVGGLLARARRTELERLNEQLRQINTALRRQAKIESYAPNLSYAPVGGRTLEKDLIVNPRKEELISHLKRGKNFLRNQDPERAFAEFLTALKLAQETRDPLEEKKAARGLGASLQRQGKYQEAVKYHSMVLDASEREGDESGNTEAYGAIADCYTELGDLERAGKFYDKYIARLEKD